MSISHWTMGLHPYPYPTTLRFSSNGMMPCVTSEPTPKLMFELPIAEHVAPLGALIKCQVYRTHLRASKNVKFRLSRNSTKFDVVARFRETIPTVKSVSSSKIYKISGFLSESPFYHSLGNLDFPGSHKFRSNQKTLERYPTYIALSQRNYRYELILFK